VPRPCSKSEDRNAEVAAVTLAKPDRSGYDAQLRNDSGSLTLPRTSLADQGGAKGAAAPKRRACALGLTVVCAALLAPFSPHVGARAQSLFGDNPPPVVGGSGGLTPLAPKPAFGGMSGPSAQLHHDGYGRVCIEIHGYSEPQATNADIFNHMLLIANGCSMKIKLHVCYYKSEHCIDVVAAPYARTLETLGIFPHMQDFRWEYTESFN
jgi:hypothetical protein